MYDQNNRVNISGWVYDPNLCTLLSPTGQVTKLRGQLDRILRVLISANGKIVSQSEIEQQVWQDQYASDNAVKSSITYLRQCFGDIGSDVIVNVRLQGYKLTNVQIIEDDIDLEVNQLVRVLGVPIGYRSIYALMSVVLLGAIGIWYGVLKPEVETVFLTKPIIKTFEKGVEMHPTVAGELLAYVNHTGNFDEQNIIIKNVNTEQSVALPNKNVTAPYLVNNSLYYVSKAKQQCNIVKIKVETDLSLSEPESIVDCGLSDTNRPIAVSQNERYIYYSYKSDSSSPYETMQFDVLSQTSKKLTTPLNSIGGDYTLTLSPDEQRIIIASYVERFKTLVREINLNDGSVRPLFTSPGFILDFSWLGDQNLLFADKDWNVNVFSFVNQDVYPIYQASMPLQYLETDDSQTIFLALGASKNTNIFNVTENGLELIDYLSSDFNESNPSFNERYQAFVSNRSGNPQVWVRDQHKKTIYPVTFFDSFTAITSVNIDEQNILSFVAGKQLFAFDLLSQKSIIFDDVQALAAAPACEEATYYIVSQNLDMNIVQLKLYNVKTDESKVLVNNVQSVYSDCSSGDVVFSDVNNNAFYTKVDEISTNKIKLNFSHSQEIMSRGVLQQGQFFVLQNDKIVSYNLMDNTQFDRESRGVMSIGKTPNGLVATKSVLPTGHIAMLSIIN